jgi:hypothetical protein
MDDGFDKLSHRPSSIVSVIMNHSLPFDPRQRHPLNKGALGKEKEQDDR